MLREVELQESAADDATLLSRGTRDPRGVPLFQDSAEVTQHLGGGAGGRRDDALASARSNNSTTFLGRVFGAMAAEPLLLKTVIGVVLGIVMGTISRAASPTPRAVELIGLPGKE